jgi:hypothetical protein
VPQLGVLSAQWGLEINLSCRRPYPDLSKHRVNER